MMKKLISVNFAGKGLLILLALLTVFHILILIEVLPPDIVWGGQLQESTENITVLELLALIVTLLFMLIAYAKIRSIKVGKPVKLLNIAMWIIFSYFILNIVSNLASAVSFENLVFAPLSVLLALFSLRLAIEI